MIRARQFASECFQVNPFTKKYSGREDCLYINVWTPLLDQTVSTDRFCTRLCDAAAAAPVCVLLIHEA